MFKYLALLLLLLAACDTYVEDKRSVDFEPIYLPDSEEEDKGSDLGTIYQQNKGNLFAMDICPTSWATSFPGVVTLTIPVVETLILVASAGN